MAHQLVINGVPEGIRLDAWWLAAEAVQAEAPQRPTDATGKKTRRRGSFLVLSADLLFWDHDLGVSVAIFTLALSAAILAMRENPTTRKQWLIWSSIQVTCNLPVIEFVQPLSLMFSFLGLTALTAWVAYGRIVGVWQALWLMLRASTIGAVQLPVMVAEDIAEVRPGAKFKRHALALVLPAAVGLVFLVLMTSANPILEQMIESLASLEFLTPDRIIRLFFWCFAVSFLWPYLNLRDAWIGQGAPGGEIKKRSTPRFDSIFNPASVRNSLILFNAMFLVQTVLDIGVLSGGAALPEGMTYAQYAHRGAYPLAMTALLAGAFAIASHKLIGNTVILRALLYLWLAQTMFLVLTAAFRLGLYVEIYALTYLRVRAFIWMGLVFIGLVLIVIKINRDLSIGWLVRSNLISLGLTLYTCCFVNFAYLIADYNQSRWSENGRFDSGYLCRLGEQALPVALEIEQQQQRRVCSDYFWLSVDPITDWQEWGFRRWRLGVYLGSHS